MPQHYVSKKNESLRMFRSDFLEFFSHVHPATPHVIFLPVVGYMIYVSATRQGLGSSAMVLLFLAGVLIWTLAEYTMHRWIFHYEPKSRIGKQLHFMLHGVHHDYPNDATRLVMPPAVSVPLAVIFYSSFLLLFGRFAPALFAGFVAGYLCYDTIHYATHHFSMRGRIWQRVKKHHLRHHYQDDHAGFGVSSPLWDHIFRTHEARAARRDAGDVGTNAPAD
jgi:sterol desaturase/sphingolipid hydroxylase (fatty acid hydroxylase superfamily)